MEISFHHSHEDFPSHQGDPFTRDHRHCTKPRQQTQVGVTGELKKSSPPLRLQWGQTPRNHRFYWLKSHFGVRKAEIVNRGTKSGNLAAPLLRPHLATPSRGLRHPRAPFRAFSRFSARVVLALRATMKRGTSDAPGELASISAATVLFVSFRVSRRRAFVSGARGGDKSRDALRRTGRDAVSSPRATPRIKVAQQPASTRPAFVVARSAPIATRAGGEQIYRSQAPPYLAAGT